MKKAYESPIAEKIAFNYRDQVVAASGGGSSGSGGSENQSTGEAFIEAIAEGWGWGACSDYQCSYFADYI